MNVKELKNIFREVDEELMVLLYEASGKHLFRKSLGELMKDTTFDKYHCEETTCVFNYDCDDKYESAEEIKKQFLICVEVTKKADPSE